MSTRDDTALMHIFVDDPARIVMIAYPDNPDWNFFRITGYCYATIGDTRNRLFIGFNGGHDLVHLGFWSSSSPNSPHGSTVRMQMVVWKHRSEGAWTSERPQSDFPTVVYRNDIDKPVYNVGSSAAETLPRLMDADVLEFRALDDVVIGKFSLRGSSRALRRLQTCTPR